MTIDTEGSIHTPDGRTLTYLSVGPMDGPLVLHQHGGPGSRFEALLLSDIAQLVGVRIVVVDRPGMENLPCNGRAASKGGQMICRSWQQLCKLTCSLLPAFPKEGLGRLRPPTISQRCAWRMPLAWPAPRYGTFGTNWAAQYLSKADAFGGRLACALSTRIFS